jgi:titin
MKRFLALALLVGLVAVVPVAASAATASPGCHQLRNPSHDAYYSGRETAPLQFYAGEILRVRAANPAEGGSFVHLLADQVIVAEAAFPGQAIWVVPADGSYVIGWGAGGNATWRVTCNAPTVPFAPLSVVGEPGDGSARISWGEPAFAGGAPIDDYQLRYRLRASHSWTVVSGEVSTAQNAYVYGLVNGKTYQFQVSAHNSFGWGPWSNQAQVKAGVPAQPGSPSTVAGDGQVQLSWGAPDSAGGAAINDYAVQYRLQGATTWTPVPDGHSTECHAYVLGLTNGESYEFRVAAKNAFGRGPWSDIVAETPTA